ncbi:hypothetical protein [Methanobrevibacter sp.]|uniref:hypothetical protein n=1 Tax=Methanobrevibacter sp. TaxID=66852 RepID=UPI00388F2B5F
MVIFTTLNEKFETNIPVEIIKELDLDKSDKILWKINNRGTVELEFIKNVDLENMVGKYKSVEDIDCVQLRKMLNVI